MAYALYEYSSIGRASGEEQLASPTRRGRGSGFSRRGPPTVFPASKPARWCFGCKRTGDLDARAGCLGVDAPNRRIPPPACFDARRGGRKRFRGMEVQCCHKDCCRYKAVHLGDLQRIECQHRALTLKPFAKRLRTLHAASPSPKYRYDGKGHLHRRHRAPLTLHDVARACRSRGSARLEPQRPYARASAEKTRNQLSPSPFVPLNAI